MSSTDESLWKTCLNALDNSTQCSFPQSHDVRIHELPTAVSQLKSGAECFFHKFTAPLNTTISLIII